MFWFNRGTIEPAKSRPQNAEEKVINKMLDGMQQIVYN
jgi:hypothetical protein